MSVQNQTSFDDHAEVVFVCDPPSGLRGIVAFHRIWQKPSVGGCRLKTYDTEDDALDDVLRLSRGMTYKSVMAGLAYGGAKAVIFSGPDAGRREAQMRAMARITDRFGGRFRTGVDFGLTSDDIDVMQSETPFVFGKSLVPPSDATAKGVLTSMTAAVRSRLGRADVGGLRVMLQGLGKVGMRLAALLVREGAIVQVADVDDERVAAACRDLGVSAVASDGAHAADADIFCPCALGGVLDDRTIDELRASIIVGSANNQLAAPRHGDLLHRRGVLYAPDYVVNAGGLIAVAAELEQETIAWIDMKLDALGDTLMKVFDAASRQDVSTMQAADQLAEQQIAMLERTTALAAPGRRSSEPGMTVLPAGGEALRPAREAGH